MNRLIFMLNNNYVALFHMDGNEFTTYFLSRFKNELPHQKEWIEMRKWEMVRTVSHMEMCGIKRICGTLFSDKYMKLLKNFSSFIWVLFSLHLQVDILRLPKPHKSGEVSLVFIFIPCRIYNFKIESFFFFFNQEQFLKVFPYLYNV